jgi:hypothetical protein
MHSIEMNATYQVRTSLVRSSRLVSSDRSTFLLQAHRRPEAMYVGVGWGGYYLLPERADRHTASTSTRGKGAGFQLPTPKPAGQNRKPRVGPRSRGSRLPVVCVVFVFWPWHWPCARAFGFEWTPTLVWAGTISYKPCPCRAGSRAATSTHRGGGVLWGCWWRMQSPAPLDLVAQWRMARTRSAVRTRSSSDAIQKQKRRCRCQ